VATADVDSHFSVKPFQKIKQLVRREATEMAVHQMRHVRLRNAQGLGDFSLFQLLVLQDFEDMVSDLCASQKLVGVLEAQIREDVARTFFELNCFSPCRCRVPVPSLNS
jgi:hypothetical protein